MPTPTEPVEEQEDIWQDEEGGGPVKSFLEHLEDLRWVLIKCAVVVGVAMIVCLIGADRVVNILKWPLEKANQQKLSKVHTGVFMLGTNRVGMIPLETNQLATLGGSNQHFIFQIEPVPVNETNWILGIKPRVAKDEDIQKYALGTSLVNLGPAAGFFVAFKVAMYAGIVLASPFLFYFVGGFIFPALKVHEKKFAYRGMAIGTVLFLVGVSFCYFALMPMALRVSAQYSNWLGFGADVWRAEEYLSFVCKFMVGMGLGFQLPLIILTLVKIGVIDYRMLNGFRRYMIVINLILGAVLTTPEIITQVLMFIPLQILYEISVFIAWRWDKQARAKAAMERERT